MTFKQKNLPIHNIPALTGGLNDAFDSSEIADNELADCENVAVDDNTIRNATGYVQWDSTNSPGPYWGVYMFKTSADVLTDVRQRQTILEYSPDGVEGWLPCTLPTTGSPASTISLTQKQPTFATLNDICIFANGQYVMSSSNGITWTNRSTILPSGDVPDIVFNDGKNRIYYVVKKKSIIWWSDINNPLTVNAASWEYIDPNAGTFIVGLGLTPTGSVLVFKENGVYELSDITQGLTGVNFVGACHPSSHHTICTTDKSVIFSGWPGTVYEYIGGIIREINGRVAKLGRNNVLKTELFTAGYYNRKYHLSMPDADVSTDYNSQEYIFHLDIAREDSIQPYMVTRNSRYFGCYGHEDKEFDYGRDISLYVGDSRPAVLTGSPASYQNTVFAFVNDFRDTTFVSGLNGEAQSCWLITKYFTENVPFYVKRFKKMFANVKVDQDVSITLGYRFFPYGTFAENTFSFSTGELNWVLDNLDVDTFSEGYGFSQETIGEVFMDIENNDKPRGIQFKISFNSINDVTIYGLAFNFRPKPRFK